MHRRQTVIVNLYWDVGTYIYCNLKILAKNETPIQGRNRLFLRKFNISCNSVTSVS